MISIEKLDNPRCGQADFHIKKLAAFSEGRRPVAAPRRAGERNSECFARRGWTAFLISTGLMLYIEN